MDANRYFEQMHKAMAAQKTGLRLILTAKYQDPAGSDAYIELWQNPADRSVRVSYTTMGRKNLNFQLFRMGWQLCHNEAGEMTGRFPAKADALLDAADLHAYCRTEALDRAKAERIVRELTRCAGTDIEHMPTRTETPAARVTVDSFIGCGAHWAYSGAPAGDCLTAAAILYWLADFLAGSERRALQSDARASHLASQWELEAEFATAIPLSRPSCTPGRTRAQAYAARARVPGKNERWQSFLTVMAAV